MKGVRNMENCIIVCLGRTTIECNNNFCYDKFDWLRFKTNFQALNNFLTYFRCQKDSFKIARFYVSRMKIEIHQKHQKSNAYTKNLTGNTNTGLTQECYTYRLHLIATD